MLVGCVTPITSHSWKIVSCLTCDDSVLSPLDIKLCRNRNECNYIKTVNVVPIWLVLLLLNKFLLKYTPCSCHYHHADHTEIWHKPLNPCAITYVYTMIIYGTMGKHRCFPIAMKIKGKKEKLITTNHHWSIKPSNKYQFPLYVVANHIHLVYLWPWPFYIYYK